MKALHEEAQVACEALRELWKALGIEPIIIWVLDRLTIMLNYFSSISCASCFVWLRPLSIYFTSPFNR
ncbi:unnamed protein product [marine sediment metagenome]|uniref:Uncharacterized protein n=1 Tax=marine sediment metagenome TaxID=412755 RepID=X1AEM2_9ZZZZ